MNRIYALTYGGRAIVSGEILSRTDKQLRTGRCEASAYRTILPLDTPQTPEDAVARFVAERQGIIDRAQGEIDAARAALAAFKAQS